MMMTLTPTEVSLLYADDSVADYVPEPVMVELVDGGRRAATCYNLPTEKVTGTNTEYASALLNLATRLEFPEDYVEQIRYAGEARRAPRP